MAALFGMQPAGVIMIPSPHSFASPGPSGMRVRRRLLSSVKFLDEAAFLHVIDKAKIDEIFGFHLGGAGVRERLYFQRLFQTFKRWIGVFNQKLVIGGIGAFEYSSVEPARVLLHNF